MSSTTTVFWFRRDLRLYDNAGLYHALKSGHPVQCIFIFDTNILDELPKSDARVTFIHDTIHQLNDELVQLGSSLQVYYGEPTAIWEKVTQQYQIAKVFCNHDYEPYAKERDKQIKTLLEQQNIEFKTFKDHVIFEGVEVEKNSGGIYTVFTPYSKKWKAKLLTKSDNTDYASSYYFKSYPTEAYFSNLSENVSQSILTLSDMGFERSDIPIPNDTVTQGLIKNYDQTRNFPAINGTSRLGIHFRFGTISIREKARKASQLNETFLNELIWRDFYAMILDHFPKVINYAFREKYDAIEWRNNKAEFQKWCTGQTGYPIVDAGMRELNATGYMHNRVRMITASFLTKHLLIDWRWGEQYFAEKLLDYDLASNNGGWQWAAGSGTDAAPYFRIFNPTSQQKKFDKDFKYIKKWISEFGTTAYPEPIVEHKFARERCLATYKAALNQEM